MGMLAVGVMNMSMGVLHRFVNVLVFVALAKVKPQTQAHKRGGDHEPRRNDLT